MNSFIAYFVAFAACAMTAEALFFENLVTSAGTGTVLTLASGSAGTGTIATVAALGGGVLLLKALAIGGLYLASRQKRSTSTEEVDYAVTLISQHEPARCYSRLICDLASGEMVENENNVILSLFNKDFDATSPSYDYAMAASVGKALKSVKACEVRYACPLSGQQIQKLF